MKTQLKYDENIILETNPHWFVLVMPLLVVLIVVAAGFLIGGYAIILSVSFIIYFLYKLVERKNELWVVTNLRVIEESGVFSKNSKESPLEKINNISYSQSVFGRLIGYGDVQIQTAAEVGATTYYMVGNPKMLKDTVTRMQEDYNNSQIRKQASELADAINAGKQNNVKAISQELEKLHELKLKGILTEEEYNNRKNKLLNS